MFIKTIFKNSKNFKRIRNYLPKWNLYLYFLISIELGYVLQILGWAFLNPPPPHPWAAPKSPILNRVKSCKRVMLFFFSKVAACNLTEKGLHQRFFPAKFLKLFRTVFNIATFAKWFCIIQAIMKFSRCFYVTLL